MLADGVPAKRQGKTGRRDRMARKLQSGDYAANKMHAEAMEKRWTALENKREGD